MTLSNPNSRSHAASTGFPRLALSPTLGFVLRLAVLWIAMFLLMGFFNVSLGAIGQGLALAPVGVGTFITFRMLEFPDLTVDGAFPIGGAVVAALIVHGTAAEWGLLAAFAAGALTGLCTALIYVLLRIEGLLASIIVMTGAYTIILRVMGSSNIPLLNERTVLTPFISPVRDFLVATFGSSARRLTDNVVGIMVFSVLAVVALLTLNWFLHTELGLALRATGKNRQMVRAVGINDRAMIVLGLMLSNGLAGVAGALTVQYLGSADVQIGSGMIVRGLASVMIGEVLLRPRTIGQSILAATVGMIVFEVLRAFVFTALNLNASDVRLASALVVLAALATPMLSARWRAWQRRRMLRAEDRESTVEPADASA